jgi:hypothetical protein
VSAAVTHHAPAGPGPGFGSSSFFVVERLPAASAAFDLTAVNFASPFFFVVVFFGAAAGAGERTRRCARPGRRNINTALRTTANHKLGM